MVRDVNEETTRRRDTVRERVKFLLDYHWTGNQRQMARDLVVSQGLISKIVNGHQGAGRGFLATLARQPGVNADWVLRGEGQPLSLPPKGTLPVALGVLPGGPREHPQLLTGQRHPVAEPLDRASRYWLELQSSSPLLRDDYLHLLAGDLLLMETDPAWTGRLDLIEGRLCGVRFPHREAATTCTLGKLYRDSLGIIFEALDIVLRLVATSPEIARPTAPEAQTTEAGSEKKVRRKVRILDREEKKAVKRRLAAQGQPEVNAEPKEQRTAVMTGQDVVAVCVYLARPSPGLGRAATMS